MSGQKLLCSVTLKKIFTVFMSLSNMFRLVPAVVIRKVYLCFMLNILQTFLKERFDTEEIKPDLWMSLEGGNTCTECGILAEDTTLYFGGATVRQAVTQDLDLRGAK